MAEMKLQGKVISIQSHVVHGYCGNRSATFPLQVLGYEVDCINTVQFSNHTQYKTFTGSSINEEQIHELMRGLKENKIFNYTHMLTGYTRSPTVLAIFTDIVGELQKGDKDFIYLCDPVMGDHGKFYVPEEMQEAYTKLLPVPNILTPNQFELELLADMKVQTIQEALAAINLLHAKGPKTIILTSSDFGKQGKLLCIGSQVDTDPVIYEFPLLDANFVGSGDLFAALFLGWFSLGMKQALKKTLQTMLSILKQTLLFAGTDRSSKAIELQIVCCKRDIETPPENIDLVEVNLEI